MTHVRNISRETPQLLSNYPRKSGNQDVTHYCPGCGHGIVHKYIAEALDELGCADRTVLISPVGCSVFAYYYFDVGNIQAAHGRAPAVATGIKRVNPQSIVISYQGDGDLAAIGGDEIIHAANRGEHITVFFINNAIYGMTGGQMAPTTLVGQHTTTCPRGRDPHNEGFPIRMCELISALEAPVYVERVSLHNAANRIKTRKAVKKALLTQTQNKGFTFVEILSQCPTGWKVSSPDSLKWIEEQMIPRFPLGVYRDQTEEAESWTPAPMKTVPAEILQLAEIPLEEHTVAADRTQVPPQYRNPRIKISGFGGQGVLLLGVAMAQLGMMEGYNVAWLPSYGPEMRGGTAHCHVNISEKPIGSPLVSSSTVCVAMNKPSLEKFETGDGAGRPADLQHLHDRHRAHPQGRGVDAHPGQRHRLLAGQHPFRQHGGAGRVHREDQAAVDGNRQEGAAHLHQGQEAHLRERAGPGNRREVRPGRAEDLISPLHEPAGRPRAAGLFFRDGVSPEGAAGRIPRRQAGAGLRQKRNGARPGFAVL